MMVLLKHASPETTDGNLPQAVWQPARLCIPLFRSHRHSGLPPALDARGAHRPFLPRRPRDLPDYERGAAETHARVPAMGRGLRAEPPYSDRMGGRQVAEGQGTETGRLRPAIRHAFRTTEAIRRVRHPEELGTGTDVPLAVPEVPDRRSQLSHPATDAHAVHPLLLLHSRRGARPLGPVCRVVPAVSDDVLPERAPLHRWRVAASRDPLSQERQCVPRCRRRGGAARDRRRTPSRGDSEAARVLDAGRRSEILDEGPRRRLSPTGVFPEPSGVLSQRHLPTPLLDPPDLRTLLRTRRVPLDRRRHRADLWRPEAQTFPGQAPHDARENRSRAPRPARVLQESRRPSV